MIKVSFIVNKSTKIYYWFYPIFSLLDPTAKYKKKKLSLFSFSQQMQIVM